MMARFSFLVWVLFMLGFGAVDAMKMKLTRQARYAPPASHSLTPSRDLRSQGLEKESWKLITLGWDRLAILFAGPNFTGDFFAIEGIYDTCYNILKPGTAGGSMMLEKEARSCELWAAENCGVDDGTLPSLHLSLPIHFNFGWMLKLSGGKGLTRRHADVRTAEHARRFGRRDQPVRYFRQGLRTTHQVPSA